MPCHPQIYFVRQSFYIYSKANTLNTVVLEDLNTHSSKQATEYVSKPRSRGATSFCRAKQHPAKQKYATLELDLAEPPCPHHQHTQMLALVLALFRVRPQNPKYSFDAHPPREQRHPHSCKGNPSTDERTMGTGNSFLQLRQGACSGCPPYMLGVSQP